MIVLKETSGEFSMTVVVIVGAIIIVGILTTLLAPTIENTITGQWNEMINDAG